MRSEVCLLDYLQKTTSKKSLVLLAGKRENDLWALNCIEFRVRQRRTFLWGAQGAWSLRPRAVRAVAELTSQSFEPQRTRRGKGEMALGDLYTRARLGCHLFAAAVKLGSDA